MDVVGHLQKKLALGESQAKTAEEVAKGVPHFEQTKNRNDAPCPSGMKRVRVDGGDSSTPSSERRYETVKAGFGESGRVARCRKR